MMTAPESWATQRISEFLAALVACSDQASAVSIAVEHIAESFEAEVCALVEGDRVTGVVGFPPDRIPHDELSAAAHGRVRAIHVPGVGECAVRRVATDFGPDEYLVVARSGSDGFDPEEISLLRGMVRVLALALRMLHTLDTERSLRELHEHEAEEKARLLASLAERQALLERLTLIQRAITTRAPLDEVLEAVTAGAASLLDDVVCLRLVDEHDGNVLRIVSTQGIPSQLREAVQRIPIERGLSGQAIRENRLVVAQRYAESASAQAELVADGIVAAMAAPVHETGRVVGTLVVGSRQPGRTYTEREQELLAAFAHHASLALNDARTVEAMNEALQSATYQASHDSLTGLPNRSLLIERLQNALPTSPGTHVAVLFIDLDDFKVVNDSLGHTQGDQLLQIVALRIKHSLRGTDTAARLGGDEFAVLLPGILGLDEAVAVADRLLTALAAPLTLDGDEVFPSASLGIALSEGEQDAEELLRNADVAMYRAKALGKGRAAVFKPEMHAAVLARMELDADMRRALDLGQFHLEYQPIVHTQTGGIAGFEALVRWDHPRRGRVSPMEFIPLAEETGFIVALGNWVLGEACRQAAIWRHAQPEGRRVAISVNLSARQLQQADLVAKVVEALGRAGLDPTALTLEITETVLMHDTDATIAKLGELKKLGLRLAIDDFGTGYSSLSYLRRFPVDVLKIDKSFIHGLTSSTGDATLVDAIVQLGRTLKIETVAEGVEEPGQLDRLREMRCPLSQGYLFARPLSRDAVNRMLEGGNAGNPTWFAKAGALQAV